MTQTWSVHYHPTSLGREHAVHVLIDVNDGVTPPEIVEHLAGAHATVIWMMQVPPVSPQA